MYPLQELLRPLKVLPSDAARGKEEDVLPEQKADVEVVELRHLDPSVPATWRYSDTSATRPAGPHADGI
eukprot:1187165-Prorocentrum_minimum.AAC.1